MAHFLLASGHQLWIERHSWNLTDFVAAAAAAAGGQRERADDQCAHDATGRISIDHCESLRMGCFSEGGVRNGGWSMTVWRSFDDRQSIDRRFRQSSRLRAWRIDPRLAGQVLARIPHGLSSWRFAAPFPSPGLRGRSSAQLPSARPLSVESNDVSRHWMMRRGLALPITERGART